MGRRQQGGNWASSIRLAGTIRSATATSSRWHSMADMHANDLRSRGISQEIGYGEIAGLRGLGRSQDCRRVTTCGGSKI